MKNWSIQDASARFGELLEACLREGPQSVTTDGGEAAVLVPIREWRRLQRSAQPALKELLLTDDESGNVVPGSGEVAAAVDASSCLES